MTDNMEKLRQAKALVDEVIASVNRQVDSLDEQTADAQIVGEVMREVAERQGVRKVAYSLTEAAYQAEAESEPLHIPMPNLIDPEDGENRAVRAFLLAYGGGNSITAEQMRNHLALSGYPCAPSWIDEASGHLTKFGAQDWLRLLFSLEQPTTPADMKPAARVNADGFLVECTDLPLAPGSVLYLGQPAAPLVPLTNEQIARIYETSELAGTYFDSATDKAIAVARAIERAHGIGVAAAEVK